VDEVGLTLVSAVVPSAHVGFETVNDHVDRPLSVLKGAIGVACHWWRR
jgi:heterodisulfide reductase subunit B